MGVKERVTARVVNLFSHGDKPLENTDKYQGDYGLFGPGSISWEILGDVSSFVGGIRALLIQAAHPEVAAGVADHSRYREDPLGRLNRTAYYVTTMTYGANPEIEYAIQMVRSAHVGVSGTSERKLSYSASNAAHSAWVHNTLTDSFLEAFKIFRRPLSGEEADRFVREQSLIGERMGANPLPKDAKALRAWIVDHPNTGPSEAMREAIVFLKKPPLSPVERIGYRVLQQAASSTIDAKMREILGLRPHALSLSSGKVLINSLRWALKASPSWKAALIRSGADFDETLFRSDV